MYFNTKVADNIFKCSGNGNLISQGRYRLEDQLSTPDIYKSTIYVITTTIFRFLILLVWKRAGNFVDETEVWN